MEEEEAVWEVCLTYCLTLVVYKTGEYIFLGGLVCSCVGCGGLVLGCGSNKGE